MYLNSYLLCLYWRGVPVDTSSSIRYRFDVAIICGKFIEISSFLKSKSMWKLWHWFDLDSAFKIGKISMTSLHGFFYVVSTSNWRNFCTSYDFLTCSALGTYSKQIWVGLMYFQLYDVITDIGTIGNISFGNFETT